MLNVEIGQEPPRADGISVQCEDGHMTLRGIKGVWGSSVDISSDCAVDLAATIAARYDLDEDEVFVALPTFGKDGTFPAPALAELISRTTIADKLAGVDDFAPEKPTTTVGWEDCEAMDAAEPPEC